MNGPVLVTGGAGFIGSHLVDGLLASGRGVRVLDDFSTGKRENLQGWEARAAGSGARLHVVVGDVRDETSVRDAVDGCAAVCHLAAVASVPRSMADPVGTGSVTHGGTVNVLRQTVGAGVPRVVLASSCAVYGDPAVLPVAEDAPLDPLSPYAEAKLASEEACASAAGAGQITAVCLRFFNVYGPRQDPGSPYSGVISLFMAAAAAGKAVTLYGDGLQTRDFVYVGDVVDALVRAVERPLTGAAVLNVGSGTQTSLLELLAVLEGLGGRSLDRRTEPARAGDVRHTRADARRAAQVLGWEAATSFADGLAETWAWYREGAATPSAEAARG